MLAMMAETKVVEEEEEEEEAAEREEEEGECGKTYFRFYSG